MGSQLIWEYSSGNGLWNRFEKMETGKGLIHCKNKANSEDKKDRIIMRKI